MKTGVSILHPRVKFHFNRFGHQGAGTTLGKVETMRLSWMKTKPADQKYNAGGTS